MTDDRRAYRTAMVVFCTAVGVDESDAADGAMIALSQKLRGGPKGSWPVDLPMPHPGGGGLTNRVEAVGVERLGIALLNHYVTAPKPTSKAWRMYGHEDPGAGEDR